MSPLVSIASVVPQSSVSDPLLFFIFVSDLPRYKVLKQYFFANDLKLICYLIKLRPWLRIFKIYDCGAKPGV